MIQKTCNVYVRERLAGILAQTDEGYAFNYDSAYVLDPNTKAVSLTLPKREEPYESTVLFPFFDGLIPEGWLLNVICHNWKLNSSNRFEILLKACEDCIGCVSIREE